MLISYRNILFILYYIFVLASFLQNVDFTPIWQKFIANKIFYITLNLILLIYFIKKGNFSPLRKYNFPLLFLFAYSFSYFASNMVNGTSGWMVDAIGNALFYFVSFYVVYLSARDLSVKHLMAPFSMVSSILILGSILTLFGFEVDFHSEDDSILAYYESAHSGFSLSGFNGVFLNQNSYGMMCLCAVVAYLVRLNISVRENKHGARIFYLFMLSLAAITVVMSLSRAAVLSCCIILFLYGILYFKSRQYFYVIMIGVPAVFASYVFLAEYYELLYLRVSNDGTSARWDIWVDALQAFEKNILYGVGNYMYYSGSRFLSAHNVYVHVLVSKGLIAFVAWLLFWSYFIISSFSNIANYKSIERYVVISSIGIISIVIHQVFESKIAATSAPLTIFSFVLLCLVVDGKKLSPYLGIK